MNTDSLNHNFELMNLLEMVDCIHENIIKIYLKRDFFGSIDKSLEDEEDYEI